MCLSWSSERPRTVFLIELSPGKAPGNVNGSTSVTASVTTLHQHISSQGKAGHLRDVQPGKFEATPSRPAFGGWHLQGRVGFRRNGLLLDPVLQL
nr:unnamed protein product [Callosobruchus chinensis]